MIRIAYRGNPEFQKDFAYATLLSSGADLVAQEGVTLKKGQVAIIQTGVFIEKAESNAMVHLIPGNRPDVGPDAQAIPVRVELQVRPRSGLAAKHSVTVLNAPGTIDVDYPDEIGVILINHGKSPFVVEPGMRIAQLVAGLTIPMAGVPFKLVEREGGYGSTGTGGEGK